MGNKKKRWGDEASELMDQFQSIVLLHWPRYWIILTNARPTVYNNARA